jgi:hypothetical protein
MFKAFLAILLFPSLVFSAPYPVIWDAACSSGIYNLAKSTCLTTGGSVSGTANTFGYFDSTGAINSNANYRFNAANGWFVLSTLGSGATTGNVGIGSSNGIGFVMGNVGGSASILSTNFGVGNIAFGDSLSSGQISAQGNGSIDGGYATNSGIVATELDASIAIGRADTSGQVSANGTATQAFGYSDLGSILGARGAGSMAMGYATNNSTLATTVNFNGQFAGGYALNAGNITSDNHGAFSFGYSDSSGAIQASGPGSLAAGRASAGANINATAAGATALGNATVFGITASGIGSFSGGNPGSGINNASGAGSFAFGDGNTGSGTLSTTFGLVNANSSNLALVAGRYANLSGSTPGSWVSTDPLFALGNGVFGSPSNALTVLKNGQINTTAPILAPDGSAAGPTFSFFNEPTMGMFRVGSGEMGFSVGSVRVLDMQVSSPGGFGNLGMGGPASLSDSYPLLIQRDIVSAGVYEQISNTDTAAFSKACFQLAADAGNDVGEICTFTQASTLAAYAGAMTVRPNTSTNFLSLIGGDLTTGYVSTFTGGDYTATGETMRFNADHSIQFMQEISTPASPATSTDKVYAKSDHNIYHLNASGTEARMLDSVFATITVQGAGVTPTCGSAQNGQLVLTSAYVLCVCNGSGWVHTSTGAIACSF